MQTKTTELRILSSSDLDSEFVRLPDYGENQTKATKKNVTKPSLIEKSFQTMEKKSLSPNLEWIYTLEKGNNHIKERIQRGKINDSNGTSSR